MADYHRNHVRAAKRLITQAERAEDPVGPALLGIAHALVAIAEHGSPETYIEEAERRTRSDIDLAELRAEAEKRTSPLRVTPAAMLALLDLAENHHHEGDPR